MPPQAVTRIPLEHRDRTLLVVEAALAVLLIVGLVVLAVMESNSEQRTIDEAVTVDKLAIGDCVLTLNWNAPRVEDTFDLVPCTEPHAAELVHRGDFGDIYDEFPGAWVLDKWADTQCSAREDLALGLDPDVRDVGNRTFRWIYPAVDGWAYSRDYTCFLTTSDGSLLTRGYSVAE